MTSIKLSVISLDMIEMFARFHNVALDAKGQFPGVAGTLRGIEAGYGSLNAHLFDAPSLREMFKPLRDAHFAAKGIESPGYSNVEDPEFLKNA